MTYNGQGSAPGRVRRMNTSMCNVHVIRQTLSTAMQHLSAEEGSYGTTVDPQSASAIQEQIGFPASNAMRVWKTENWSNKALEAAMNVVMDEGMKL